MIASNHFWGGPNDVADSGRGVEDIILCVQVLPILKQSLVIWADAAVLEGFRLQYLVDVVVPVCRFSGQVEFERFKFLKVGLPYVIVMSARPEKVLGCSPLSFAFAVRAPVGFDDAGGVQAARAYLARAIWLSVRAEQQHWARSCDEKNGRRASTRSAGLAR